MKKAIEIGVLRVSSNGKYIEFIINCPRDFYFTDFVVSIYDGGDKYSLKDCLFVDHDHTQEDSVQGADGLWYYNKHYYSGQFKVEDIGAENPEMYEIELKAEHNPDCEEEEVHYKGTLIEKLYISDVSSVYSCLMDDISQLGEDLCDNSDVEDELIRNYLILYAHQEAMKLRELSDAKKYFGLLQKCFTTCGKHHGSCSTCGTHNYSTYKPNNCGCR